MAKNVVKDGFRAFQIMDKVIALFKLPIQCCEVIC